MKWRFILATLVAAGAIYGVLWLIPESERAGTKQVDYVELFRTLKPKAEQGDTAAQYQLGYLYKTGQGVARDGRMAAQWYQRAAERGHVAAQFALGKLYDKGEGVAVNTLRAIQWYQLAYRQALLPEAAFALGNLYFRGRGVLKDHSEAIAWFRRAATQGYPCAQFLLGGVYEEGWAVNRDPVEAYKWYTLAMPKQAMCLKIDRKYDAEAARKRLAKRLTQFQIKKGEERAAAWRPSRQ